jgi:hypothetical protein
MPTFPTYMLSLWSWLWESFVHISEINFSIFDFKSILSDVFVKIFHFIQKYLFGYFDELIVELALISFKSIDESLVLILSFDLLTIEEKVAYIIVPVHKVIIDKTYIKLYRNIY